MKQYHTVIPAVYLILRRDNEVLLLRRFNTGYQDGSYSLVSGHFEGNESATSALVREAQEEAGIAIQPQDLKLVHLVNRNLPDQAERMDLFFECRVWQGEPTNKEPDKCDDLSWFDLATLPPKIAPEVKQALSAYLDNQSYSELGW